MFNLNPLKAEWQSYALDAGIVESVVKNKEELKTALNDPINKKCVDHLAVPKSVGQFLRFTPGLSKTQIGIYVGKGPADLFPFHAAVLHEYVDTFDFSGKVYNS